MYKIVRQLCHYIPHFNTKLQNSYTYPAVKSGVRTSVTWEPALDSQRGGASAYATPSSGKNTQVILNQRGY